MNVHLRIVAAVVLAMLLIAACAEDKMGTLEIGEPATVTLKGTVYRIEWVSPTSPPSKWGDVEYRAEGPYEQHVHPIYNLQEDIPADRPEDNDWEGLWEQLASDLSGKVEWYAIAAYEGDKLAGMIRFLPKTLTGPRYGSWTAEEHRMAWSDRILWIGAAFVDLRGAEGGLDVELVRSIVQYARQKGFARIQGLGWSEVRAYAMWGQSLPVSVYVALGFRRIATVDATHLHALSDMLAGHHDDEVQALVRADMEAGELTEKAASEFYIVEHDLD